MQTVLFSDEPTAEHHPVYARLRGSRSPLNLRNWCEQTYELHGHQLDRNFPSAFRRDFPHRFSELFFASAFARAGWRPVSRVPGFDLAYRNGEHRLLVEVTTPNPPPPESWTEETRNGQTLFSGDSRTVEASLLRLTTALSAKAKRIDKVVEADQNLNSDYKVVAISGFRISQETPFSLSESGPVPDFVRGLLGIGEMYARFPIGVGSDQRPVEWGHQSINHIRKPSGAVVARTTFLEGLVPNIDAVAFSSINLFGVSDPHLQVGVLHNPTSQRAHQPCDLGMGNEYFVKIETDTFDVRRRKLSELPDD